MTQNSFSRPQSQSSLLGKSMDGPSFKLSTAVFVKSSNHGGCWTPAEIIGFDTDRGSRNSIEVVLSPDEDDCIMTVNQDDEYDSTGNDSWVIMAVDLNAYPKSTLPLQEIDEYGRRVVHPDLTDMQYLHEAGILYNLKDRHKVSKPYTRAGNVIIAMNPYKWIRGLYSEENKRYYADRLVWRPKNGLKSVKQEPHVYEVSCMAYKGLLGFGNGGYVGGGEQVELVNQAILISGESGSGKTETVKILMDHLATFSATRNAILENEARENEAAKLNKTKKGLIRRTSTTVLRKISRFASLRQKEPKEPIGMRKIMTGDTESTSSSLSMSCDESDINDSSIDPLAMLPLLADNPSCIIERVLETNVILEAFGNAKTVRNDNSSRFGKFIQLQFKNDFSSCKLAGSFCDTYLLEKSRVVHHGSNERTFHIFYQLLAAPDEVKVDIWEGLLDTNASSFKYVGGSSTNCIEGKTDAEHYFQTLSALDVVGIKNDTVKEFMKALCCVLQLGNLVFKSSPEHDGSVISSKKDLMRLAELMGLEADMITQAFTTASVTAIGEVFYKQVRPAAAKERCDALAKAIYSSLFDWLVNFINDATKTGCDGKEIGTIGLLDIFGFESFKTNKFEQLLINHANERLQAKFTNDVFRSVQEEYENEGISIDQVDFKDNADVLRLIEGRMGLMSLLNEECILPRGNDINWCAKIYKKIAHDKMFTEKNFQKDEFGINHYAGKIRYSAAQIVSKNQDYLPNELITCALSCRNAIINESFAALSTSFSRPTKALGRNSSMLGAGSAWGKFKVQLDSLMKKLSQTETRYVRCIKPNMKKLPEVVELSHCLEQIRCAGVVEAVTVSRQCFPNRLPFAKVLDLFGDLWKEQPGIRKKGKFGQLVQRYGSKKSKESQKEKAEALLHSIFRGKESAFEQFQCNDYDVSYQAPFVCGETVVYFRAGALEFIEALRMARFDSAATVIQSFVRRQRAMAVYRSLYLMKQCKVKKKRIRPVKNTVKLIRRFTSNKSKNMSKNMIKRFLSVQ